jgi:hypothetical protein
MCKQHLNSCDLVTADDEGEIEQELLFQDENDKPGLGEEWFFFIAGLHPATWMFLFLLLCLFISLVDQFVNGVHIH